jgi:hypothetical protein
VAELTAVEQEGLSATRLKVLYFAYVEYVVPTVVRAPRTAFYPGDTATQARRELSLLPGDIQLVFRLIGEVPG